MEDTPVAQSPRIHRIAFNAEKGFVRYRGKLLHKVDNSKIKADEEWIGVEWDDSDQHKQLLFSIIYNQDDPTKGKHNGTVEGTVYFTCRDNLNAGSLVLAKKATFGQEILEAIIRRYFKDHEVNEILKHKGDIVNYLREKWVLDQQKYNNLYQNITPLANLPSPATQATGDSKPADSNPSTTLQTEVSTPVIQKPSPSDDSMFEDDSPGEMGEGKASPAKNMSQNRLDNVTNLMHKIKDRDCFTTKQVATEYDEDAIIRTFGKRTKKIEFKGFDKVWERIYHLDKVIEMCLAEQHIEHFGAIGGIGRIASSLKNISLEKNLLHDWGQILVLGTELRQLHKLGFGVCRLAILPLALRLVAIN